MEATSNKTLWRNRNFRLLSRRQSRLRDVGPHAPPGTSDQQYSSFILLAHCFLPLFYAYILTPLSAWAKPCFPSELDHDLEGFALVHSAVSVGHSIKIRG